jgi:hypothetical protein
VITHRMPMESFNEAMKLIRDGDAGKIVFEIS